MSDDDKEKDKYRGRFWQLPERRGVISEDGRKWLEENAEAIESSNEWVEKNGLPLDEYRRALWADPWKDR
jgi:hypothetical protein